MQKWYWSVVQDVEMNELMIIYVVVEFHSTSMHHVIASVVVHEVLKHCLESTISDTHSSFLLSITTNPQLNEFSSVAWKVFAKPSEGIDNDWVVLQTNTIDSHQSQTEWTNLVDFLLLKRSNAYRER